MALKLPNGVDVGTHAGVPAPVNATDAAQKAQVDAIVAAGVTNAQMTAAIATAIAALPASVTAAQMNSAISTAIAPFVTVAAMNAAIATAVTALPAGVTIAQVNAAIATAVAPYSTTAQMNAAIATAIGNIPAGASVASVNALKFYDVAGGFIGMPTASEIVTTLPVVRAFSIAAGPGAHQAFASTAAAASTQFTFQKRTAAGAVTTAGTMTFAANSKTAVFSMNATTFAAGDALLLVAPNAADSALQDGGFTIAGTLP
jgi:hypothetical protein